jgi:hypothetical protein
MAHKVIILIVGVKQQVVIIEQEHRGTAVFKQLLDYRQGVRRW